MFTRFRIVPSSNNNEPGASYFASLEAAAHEELRHEDSRFLESLVLREYLDCVDAGDLKSTPSLYDRALQALARIRDCTAAALAGYLPRAADTPS